MKHYPFVCVLVWAAAAVGPGCTSYRFNVDAVSAQPKAVASGSYVIVDANPEIAETDLRYLEAVEYLHAALSAKGLYQAPAGVEPDMVIEFDFGMESRRDELLAYNRPGLVVATTASQPAEVGGTRERRQNMGAMVPVGDALADGLRLVKVTSYPKYLRITAREGANDAKDNVQRELWSVFVSNEDDDNDLRKYVPLMISAAMDSLSSETAEDYVVVLRQDDARVAFVQSME